MASCVVCQRDLSFFESLFVIGKGRCRQCNEQFSAEQQRWLMRIDQAFANGGVPRGMEQAIYGRFQEIRMPQDLGQAVIQKLRYLRNLSEISWGNVPLIHVDIHLDSDEMAHFQMPTTYYKPNKQVKLVPGQMIGTNKKLYFLSSVGRDSATIDWNNVSRVEQIMLPAQPPLPGIRLTVSKGAGGGVYSVSDSLYTKVIIDTLVRLWKRQLVIYQEIKTHGPVPEHIKAAVFQRDKGRCIQCGSDADGGKYLEYDHKIPRSKGGPNTVENIQLLCRQCNLKKGNRI